MKNTTDGSRETRSYESKDAADQALNDLYDNGANPVLHSSGGDADGTGGDYTVEFDHDTYQSNKDHRA